jgi:hypothetical protein
VTLREENKLKVLVKMSSGKIYGPERNELSG